MYIGDVGQNLYEEIDFEPGTSPGGMNYQWRVMEGKHSYSPSTSYTVGTKVAPILEYPHAQATLSGCSVTGGVVYRGCSMPDLQGAYFFAEYCNDWIRTLRVENGKAVNIQDRSAEIRSSLTDPSPLSEIVAFGVDGRGEVYICDLPGKLYRVISANPPSSARLFQRGNANGDDSFDISDPVATLLHLFGGSSQSIPCSDAYDSNDDGKIDLSDAVYSLSALFTGGPVPPPPGFRCGSDPTEDALACDASTCR